MAVTDMLGSRNGITVRDVLGRPTAFVANGAMNPRANQYRSPWVPEIRLNAAVDGLIDIHKMIPLK